MSYNIVLGTRKTVRAVGGYQKFEDEAVVTIEAAPEKGKNRRVLFNSNSMETLELLEGAVQNIVFGFIDADENGNRRLLIANVGGNDLEDTVVYSTSKNKAAFHDSKEKGKAISSKALTTEISEFLELDGAIQGEYRLSIFEGNEPGGIVLYEMINVNDKTPANVEVTTETLEETSNFDVSPVINSDEDVAPLNVNEDNGRVEESDSDSGSDFGKELSDQDINQDF